MYSYKIVDNSVNGGNVREGQATSEQLKELLPKDIYDSIITLGSISIKVNAGHESYEITKVQ
jgi:hypothetical protein